ncbi:NACHT domain-containing protein [Streptomyces sp. NPDC050315]|uniref:NACHT domain-containing protein n=1 Tax=Streptomyces sp. NPDC050315 TaxID=3155039 RepID=UPI0034121CAB
MRRFSRATLGLVLVTAFLLPVATNLATGAVPEQVVPYLWLSWPVALVLALVAAFVEARRGPPEAEPDGGDGTAGDARERRTLAQLAATVRQQWEEEAGIRMLHRPRPLNVRWSATPRPVSARPGAVLGGTVGGRPLRLRLLGGLDEVVPRYLALPRRQLVVLGGPGAGKTVLAMVLTLGLLERRGEHGGPVPVLLSMSSWDPHGEHLFTWVARRLAEDYPALANPDVFGPHAATRLATGGHILPVLDGLDEMPAPLRPAALAEIDRAAAGRPFVVTCRSTEYETAVTSSGQLLATAAVVELAPVDVPETISFLTGGTVAEDARWAPVFARLREQPGTPLAQALSAPLMAAMARTAYMSPATDPAELLDAARFPERDAVEEHLLDAFVPAVYAARTALPGTGGGRTGTDRCHSPEQALRWLAFLATHLHRQGTRDLAWWRLHRAFSPCGCRVAALVLELISGLVGGLAAGLSVGLAAGLAAGTAASVVAGLLVRPPVYPQQVNIRLRGRGRRLGRRLGSGLTVGLATGVGAGVGAGLLAELTGGRVVGLLAGLMAGIGLGVSFGVMEWLNTPADALSSASPESLLRNDRAVMAIRFLVETLGSGLVAGVVVALVFERELGVMTGLTVGLGTGLSIGAAGRLVGRFQTGLPAGTWSWFLVTRAWYALRGDLPWRLMRFLRDAHRRGVLRRNGPVYQFRHARLQDRLSSPVPSRPRGPRR